MLGFLSPGSLNFRGRYGLFVWNVLYLGSLVVFGVLCVWYCWTVWDRVALCCVDYWWMFASSVFCICMSFSICAP